MKKKLFIILSVLIVLLISTSLITSYIDSARVRNAVEPKHTVKIVSEDGSKVTYWGLGYKVIRYPSVSPNEPYKNNRGVKYGSWFMKYEPSDNTEKNVIIDICDRTEQENISCDTAFEKFYEDQKNEYYFNVIKSQYITVTYNNGTTEDIVTAINAGRATLKDLDEFGIKYYTKQKTPD